MASRLLGANMYAFSFEPGHVRSASELRRYRQPSSNLLSPWSEPQSSAVSRLRYVNLQRCEGCEVAGLRGGAHAKRAPTKRDGCIYTPQDRLDRASFSICYKCLSIRFDCGAEVAVCLARTLFLHAAAGCKSWGAAWYKIEQAASQGTVILSTVCAFYCSPVS